MKVSVLMTPADDAAAVRRTRAALAAQRGVAWELHEGKTAAALSRATGAAVVLVRAGDELAPGALARAAAVLEAQAGVDVVYADEDRVSAAGARHTPFLRPGWSPDYLLTALYVDRAFVARRAAVVAAGGFATGAALAPEWDLLLRLAEGGKPFARIPEVLFHRPGEPGDPWRPAERALVEAGREAVEAACRRRGEDARVIARSLAGTYRVVRRPAPVRTSLIVPFRDGAILLARCLQSVFATAGEVPLEVVLVDNGSVEPETAALLREAAAHPGVQVIAAPGPFNFSGLVNRGAAAATGDVLCLLNSDVEALAPGWLEALLGEVLRPDVGAVGAKLLYPDGSIQHVGIVLGLFGATGHAHRFAPRDAPGYFGSAAVVREVSAVTGACLAVRREVFAALGGLDETLPGAYNDVDFCLRLQDRGYRVLYTPDAALVHHEGASRGREDADPAALARMRQRWGGWLADDPFHHPGLARDREEIAPAPPPPPGGAGAWLARQGRRLRWLGRDVARALATWGETFRRTSGSRATIGVALLAGAPLAACGEVNRYWLRLCNRGSRPATVEVELRGAATLPDTAREFLLREAHLLEANASVDLACETDWAARFVLVRGAALVGAVVPGAPSGRCELVATVRAGDVAEVTRITQPLAA